MPHPFTWAPGAHERHASQDPAPTHAYAAGQNVDTLCGRTVTVVDGEIAWLWPSCPDCDQQTRLMVGAPTADAIAQRATT